MSSPSALLLFTGRYTHLLYYHYEDPNPFVLNHKSLPKPQFQFAKLRKVQVKSFVMTEEAAHICSFVGPFPFSAN